MSAPTKGVRSLLCMTCYTPFSAAKHPDPAAALAAHYQARHPEVAPGWWQRRMAATIAVALLAACAGIDYAHQTCDAHERPMECEEVR